MLLQRVIGSRVIVDGKEIASIKKGILIFLGIEESDQVEDANYLSEKLIPMRIFSDSNNKINLNILEVDGELLLVSQFTLFASTKKGNRPSFIRAARPEKAKALFDFFKENCTRQLPGRVKAGIFGADMQVELTNDGPFTLLLDSRNKE